MTLRPFCKNLHGINKLCMYVCKAPAYSEKTAHFSHSTDTLYRRQHPIDTVPCYLLKTALCPLTPERKGGIDLQNPHPQTSYWMRWFECISCCAFDIHVVSCAGGSLFLSWTLVPLHPLPSIFLSVSKPIPSPQPTACPRKSGPRQMESPAINSVSMKVVIFI